MANIKLEKNSKIKLSFIYFGISMSIAIIVLTILALIFYPSIIKETYFNLTHPIIFQGEVFEEEAIIEDENTYLPYSFFTKHIDPNAVYDKDSNSIIITTKNKVIQIPDQSLAYYVNQKEMNLEFPSIKNKDGRLYVNIEPLLTIYPFKTTYVKETGATFIEKHNDVVKLGIIKGNLKKWQLQLRKEPKLISPSLAEVAGDEQVRIENAADNYYYVRKENGIAGYIKKSAIDSENETQVVVDHKQEEVAKPKIALPIHLTWEAVYSKNPDPKKLSSLPGVNVVSPTWFSIKNSAGDIHSKASIPYVNWAKQNNKQVWALFSNQFDPQLTSEALQNFKTREKMIKQLLLYCQLYKLDGINVDFENVNLKDRDLVTQFMRELSANLHQASLIVSMDITFISGSENWSKFYDREKLSQVVDYMIVMAYDEHWASSPKSGSVASLPWVEKNLNELLKVVPNEKLILGVPFYTRVWQEKKNDAGELEIKSKSYSMSGVNEWINSNKLKPIYDAKSRQNYVEYYNQQENAVYKVWLEDQGSLEQRVNLVHQHNLAGIGSWNRVFASENAWFVVNDALRNKNVVKSNK